MIEKITKEVLVRLGFDQPKAQEYANERVTTRTIINDNHIFIDGVNRLVFSKNEGARKYYFKTDNIEFPNKAPQLIEEYYNLNLVLYIKNNEASNFPDNDLKKEFHEKEIAEVEQDLERAKDKYKVFSKNPEFTKTKTRYLNWLNKKQKVVKTDEVLKNEFDKIFKNDIGFTIFTKMFEYYKDDKNTLANFSFLFHAMEKDFLVCSQTKFREFLRNEKYNIEIEKIDSRQSGKTNKTKLYNSIKDKYQQSTIKAQ